MKCPICNKFSLKWYRFFLNGSFECPVCLQFHNLLENNDIPNIEPFINIECFHVVCHDCINNIKETIRITEHSNRMTSYKAPPAHLQNTPLTKPVFKAPPLLSTYPKAFPKEYVIPHFMLPPQIINSNMLYNDLLFSEEPVHLFLNNIPSPPKHTSKTSSIINALRHVSILPKTYSVSPPENISSNILHDEVIN